jgi:ligand-binding SRPBCC domain-containing protein
MDLTHTSRITKYERPGHFQDCMIRGHFQSFTHDHLFEEHGNKTFMTDIVQFQAPLGIISQPIDRFLLKPHIEKFLLRRNEHIRRIAEGEDWKRFLR